MVIITKLLFSMKHGIIRIYIIDFLNWGIQDRHNILDISGEIHILRPNTGLKNKCFFCV